MGTREVLLLRNFEFDPDDREMELLCGEFPQLCFTATDERSYVPQDLARYEIIVGSPRPEDLKWAKHLRWLQTQTSGVDRFVDRSLFARSDILLSNASGAYGRQIADQVIATVIAFNHSLLHYHSQMTDSLWQVRPSSADLWEQTLLVIGLGDLGRHVVQRAKWHGMRVIAVKRTIADTLVDVDVVATLDGLEALLPEADYVVLCAPSTAETRQVMDRRRIALMKRSSFLINVARGTLVDHDALTEALRGGHLAGAALDVTDPEPLHPGHPLWTLPNVLITPHSSGLSCNDPRRVFKIVHENMRKYLAGQPLRNQVDFDRTY